MGCRKILPTLDDDKGRRKRFEGEGEDDAVASAHDSIFSDLGEIAPVASSGDNGILSLLADDQLRAKRNRQAE